MFWDLSIVESGNGGELQLVGNDLAVVNGLENMPYLGMFGGSIDQVTKSNITEERSLDYWANNLLMANNPSIQLNSLTERILNTVNLTSSGRQLIENTIKEDLKFLSDLADIEVSVTIVSTDRIDVKLRIKQFNASTRIIVINFKKSTDGDFWILDFNDDFLV